MKKIFYVIAAIFAGFLYLYWLNNSQMDGANKYMEMFNKQSQENFDKIYSDNYKPDYEAIVNQEEIKKVNAIKLREDDLIAEYWRRAKSMEGQQIGAIPQKYNEIYADLVVKDVENGNYNSLQQYLLENYPTSRLVNFPIIETCKKYLASREQCATMLAIAGVESGMDTNYVTHGRVQDIEGGRARNNMWGLKMNKRYANLKGISSVTRPPYDNYSFVDFSTLDSGTKFFLEFLNQEYKGASQPSHLHPAFNQSDTWLLKANRFYNILLPLIKY